MNKGELVDAISNKIHASKSSITEILSVTLEVIAETVASDEKVTLVGFGTFEPRDRKEREGRNPKTGENMTHPATVVPAFKAGKTFKEQVKNNG